MKAKKKHIRYKIEPLEKKSIVQTTTFKKGEISISREETYRWGYAIVEANKKDLTKQDEIVVSDYDMIDHSYEDCSALFWDYPDDLSDSDREAIENAYEEDGDDGLEKLGWNYFDSEDKIIGPLKITKCN